MEVKMRRPVGGKASESGREPRLNIHFAEATLDALAAWARAEGRSTPAQARFLIEQAVMGRLDRLALTRR
jgi:hypothetical protein